MRVTSLGSGSSGNSLLIEAGPQGRTKILIDAGFPGRVVTERLRIVGVTPAQLQGILITHEHIDHILGVPLLTTRHVLPIITDPRTYTAMQHIFTESIVHTESGTLIPLEAGYGTGDPRGRPGTEPDCPNSESARPDFDPDSALFRPLPLGTRTVIGDIEVISFPVSHDATAPCGYLLSAGGCRVCVVIDTGVVTNAMLEAIKQADLLILESNHDRARLLRGPYPYMLKQRILSETGHLSNDQAAEAVLRTWRSDAVRWLWLSHLSRTNNTPKLALQNMRERIEEAGANLAQIHISVLPPQMGGVWDSTQLWHSHTLWEMPG